MNIELKGNPAFGFAHITLEPNETLITESGAMATMESHIELISKLNGGFLKGLIRKFLGGESLFINNFINFSNKPSVITLTQPTPGGLILKELNGEEICLQPSAFVACEEDVEIGTRFAGLVSFISGEGLFKITAKGHGKLLFGGFGGIMEKQVIGETIIDTGHLVAYDPSLKLKIQMSGGIISSLTSGEGLVTRVEGEGKVWIQSRNLQGFASWINRFF
jgi:uncharacterized protein (TIGR00266 family)